MITLLIPTKNRATRLYRTLDYYNQVKLPYKIIITDSSNEDVRVINRETIQFFSRNLDIQYHEYQQDISFLSKLISTIDLVETEYVIIPGDDDYLITSTIEKGISFLNKNPDYSVVHGQAYVFYLQSSKNSSTIKFIEPYYQRSIEDEHAGDRLINHLSSYATTFQSIHRTDQLKNSIKSIDLESQGTILFEMYLTSADVLLGKTLALNDLYIIRESSPVRDHPKGPSQYSSWVLTNSFREPYSISSTYLAHMLSDIENIPFSEAVETVDQAFSGWLIHYLTPDCLRFRMENASGFWKLLLQLSEDVKTKKILFILKMRDINSRARLFWNIPLVRNHYEKFLPVYNSIMNFRE